MTIRRTVNPITRPIARSFDDVRLSSDVELWPDGGLSSAAETKGRDEGCGWGLNVVKAVNGWDDLAGTEVDEAEGMKVIWSLSDLGVGAGHLNLTQGKRRRLSRTSQLKMLESSAQFRRLYVGHSDFCLKSIYLMQFIWNKMNVL